MPVLSPTSSPTWTDERIELLKRHFEAGLSCREIAADLRVTQTVNGSKGIHCMIAKAVVHG